MITTVINEAPFQVLTSSFSISPSTTGYDLEISADGTNFSKLFTVSANTTKLVTNVASGSYYRLKGNVGEVKINWRTSCNSGGGGADLTNYYTKDETDAAIDAAISGITIDLSDYYTSAQTETAITSKGYITSADTTNLVSKTELLEKEEVISTALNELHNEIPDVSTLATAADLATVSGTVSALTAELSEAERVTSTAVNDIRNSMVSSTTIRNIVAISQTDYDALTTKDNNTLYYII